MGQTFAKSSAVLQAVALRSVFCGMSVGCVCSRVTRTRVLLSPPTLPPAPPIGSPCLPPLLLSACLCAHGPRCTGPGNNPPKADNLLFVGPVRNGQHPLQAAHHQRTSHRPPCAAQHRYGRSSFHGTCVRLLDSRSPCVVSGRVGWREHVRMHAHMRPVRTCICT